jgi:peptidyl-prolyl cis-trans isomerase SurA
LQSLKRLLLTLTLLGISAPAPAAQLVDGIAAVVNDEVITLSELNTELERTLNKLRQRMGPGKIPPRDTLRRQLLDRMIMDRIQIQRARKRGIEISQREVDQAVARVARNNGMRVAQFRQAIQQRGMRYDQYRSQLKEQILRNRLVNQAVRSQVHVTDEEVDSYLTRQGQGGDRHEYQLQQILVSVPENATPAKTDQRRQQARQLLERIESGESFARVAAAESDGQKALEGGELGWFKPGEMPTAVLAAVEPLEEGEHTGVVRTPSGFHIFRVQDRRPISSATQTQIQARHILLRTDAGRSKAEARSLARELVSRIRDGADFAELAAQYSEGPSGKKGGSLGWVGRGEMVSAFEEAAFSLSPGEVTGPVETQYGIHVIQVTDQRDKEIDPDNQRKSAREALRTRKTRERMDQWLRQLRAQAYIDIRLGGNGGG